MTWQCAYSWDLRKEMSQFGKSRIVMETVAREEVIELDLTDNSLYLKSLLVTIVLTVNIL